MEEINTAQFTERMNSHENRLKSIEAATQLEYELQNSVALPLFAEIAQKEADDALAALATVDPSDYKKIISLQAMVYRSTLVTQTIIAIRTRGAFASKAMNEEAELEELPDGE